MYCVYVLKSLKDGKRYIGCTSDLNRRLKEHNSGRTKSLKNRKPLIVIYKEEIKQKEEAFKREKYLKSGKGRGELNKKINASARPPKADSI